MSSNSYYKSRVFGFLSERNPQDLSSVYFNLKSKFQRCKSFIRIKFEESMLDLEDFKRYQSKISPSSPPNKIKIGKKEDVKLREPPSQYFPAKHRKLQISHLLKDQKHDLLCLRYNSKTNIKHIINKSDDLKQRIIDCDSSTDLNFYNITDKTISHIPEVLPFKYFRQKRFLKMSKKALSNLEEKLDLTNDRIERIKQTFSFSQVEEPIPLPHTPFFMRNRREKNTFLKISKVSSPLNSRSITPPTKIQLNNPLNMSPITPFELNEVKKNFRERIKLKRSSVILKRDGFLQENALDKKRKSVIENPFQLMMRGKIMGIRPKKEKNAMKFEKRLLRIAFDRGEKLVNLNGLLKTEKLRSPRSIKFEMKKLSNQTIKENTIQHNIYNEILLDLYNKKDNLSQTEIKFVDLMKKLIEKGVIINQQGLKKMLEIKFTKEEMKDPDFLDLYENCIRKL